MRMRYAWFYEDKHNNCKLDFSYTSQIIQKSNQRHVSWPRATIGQTPDEREKIDRTQNAIDPEKDTATLQRSSLPAPSAPPTLFKLPNM